MLISCDRHTKKDLVHWEMWKLIDKANSLSEGFNKRCEETIKKLKAYFRQNPQCYVGVSWGKDSVVLAHMIFNHIKKDPLHIYIRMLDNENPYSGTVRDLFINQYPINYEEISYSYQQSDASWFKNGKPDRWYQIIDDLKKKYGAHVTGIRKDESAKRKIRFICYGRQTVNSFSPFDNFTVSDIFAYLYKFNLPIHPNYAMTSGGLWERNRIRVASIGNREGDGMGRLEWEKQYYGDFLRKIEASTVRCDRC